MMRTLIVTVGQTPQVVTGALHSLLTQSTPWVPDKILLATTKLNESRLIPSEDTPPGLRLLGAYGRLREVYDATGRSAAYVEPNVRLAEKASGHEVQDVRTAEDVSAFANLLLGLVRDATEDANSELHLCLAGGRKSMSFIAGQVMSLYGRAQDVLSHVLVAPSEFEYLPGFWHPAQPDTIVLRETGKTIDPSSAKFSLHQVPFIRLRAYLPRDEAFQAGRVLSYEAAVARASEALAIDRMVVDFPASRVRVGPYEIKADPKELALAATIAYAARHNIELPQEKADYEIADARSEAFLSAWSSFRVVSILSNSSELACDLREDPAGFERERHRTATNFVYDNDAGQIIARLRKKARELLAPALASKLFARRGLRTSFATENIEILLPQEAHGFDLPEKLSTLIFVDQGRR